MATPEQPVTVSISDLERGNIPLDTLQQAFGPSSLGILIVKDLPSNFAPLRARVLSYSSYLANLPPSVLSTLENEAASYLVGWSHGKEKLKPGVFDLAKGSYYVNCGFYQSQHEGGGAEDSVNGTDGSGHAACHSGLATTTDGATKDGFLGYTSPNLWPGETELKGFRQDVEDLCRLIIDTAALVARACDLFAEQAVDGYEPGYLERIVKASSTTKARLLHYFPNETAPNLSAEPSTLAGNDDDDDWCATHLDHGCLTGLTSAMFVDEAARKPEAVAGEVPEPLPELNGSPDPRAGLYIHSRSGRVTKVAIPRDCLAFQTGEALERITEGKFKAVPHFVKGIAPGVGGRVARNTLAVFTQPNLHELVDRERSIDFAAFSQEVVNRNK